MPCWPSAAVAARAITPGGMPKPSASVWRPTLRCCALPTVPLEPCEKRAGRVSSTSLVRYRGNDYSVPAAYGFRDVVVKGFVDQVVILCGGAVVARHKRAYGA